MAALGVRLVNLYEFVRQNNRLDLLLEWDREANAALDPAKLAPSDHTRVAWVCAKGHRWTAALSARTGNGTGCPYCGGQKAVPGETDLATLRPDLLALWHPTKNGALSPRMLGPSSHRSVWWRCANGHEWQARVYAVSEGSGCPYCAGSRPIPGKTDLATTHPALAAEWDAEKNGCPASSVTYGARAEAWWRCALGHSFKTPVYARVRGDGCPYCSGKKALAGFNDLATTDPELAKEWAEEGLLPTEITRGNHRAVKWRCALGHVYEAPVYARASGSGCPYCAGRKVLAGFNDLAVTHPRLAAQWDETLNGDLSPQMVSKGSNKKVWWRCAEGHVWQAAVYSRTRSRAADCPVCAGTVKTRYPRRALPERPLPKPIPFHEPVAV